MRECPPPQTSHQPIYPYTVVCEPPDGIYTLNGGSAIVFPLDLAAGQVLSVAGVHLSAMDMRPPTIPSNQDHTLRLWISPVPMGAETASGYVRSWRIPRVASTLHIMDASIEPPAGSLVRIELLPGEYWLNVLNLSNSANAFQLSLT